MLATHRYKKNPDSPVGNELDLSEGETLVYLMKHDDNDHWWLEENGRGQVGYVPASYLMIIIDDTLQEEDSDTTRKEGQGKGTEAELTSSATCRGQQPIIYKIRGVIVLPSSYIFTIS